MAKKRDYHVLPNPSGGWSIKREGETRSSGVFDRKSDAVHHARDLARSTHSALIAHGKDGRIQGTEGYWGNQPPPREADYKGATPKGYGSLSGKILVRRDVDISKPIYGQTEKNAKKSKRDRKR